MVWKYPRPKPGNTNRIVVDQLKSGRMCQTETWGGKIFENIIQAISRDIFATMLMAIEDANIPITWHVHDEVIIEAPEDEAEAVLEKVLELMRTPPAWASTIPLNADAKIYDRYEK